MELPTSVDSECIIIGRMMRSINAVNSAVEKLEPQDFSKPEHQSIFQAILDLYKADREVEPYSVAAQLSLSVPEHSDIAYLFGLTQFHTHDDADHFIEIVRDCSLYRRFILHSMEQMTLAENQKMSPTELHADHVKKLDQIFAGKGAKTECFVKDKFNNYRDSGLSFIEYIWKQKEKHDLNISTINGLKTNYPKLDETLDGLNKGHLIIIGARPKVGKTTFLTNLMYNLLLQKIKVGFFSVEMKADDIAYNLACRAAEIESSKVKRGQSCPDELNHLTNKIYEISDFPLLIDDQENIPINQLCARARRWVQTQGIEIIFIDYLTLINPGQKFQNKQEAIQHISSSLRALAKSLNIPVVCAAQLNRSSEIDKRKPSLHDLRESGQIEQDAVSVIMLHRPEVDNPYNCPAALEVLIVKNRFGSEATLSFTFQKTTGLIREIGFLKQDKVDAAKELKDMFHKTAI